MTYVWIAMIAITGIAAYLVRNKFKALLAFDTSAHHLFDQAKLEALHVAAKAVAEARLYGADVGTELAIAEADLKSAKDAALVEIERIKAEVIAIVSGHTFYTAKSSPQAPAVVITANGHCLHRTAPEAATATGGHQPIAVSPTGPGTPPTQAGSGTK